MEIQRKLIVKLKEKQEKPIIEDVVIDNLDEVLKKHALDFITYMRKNKIPPKCNTTAKIWDGVLSGINWGFKYKNKPLCCIHITSSSGFGYRDFYEDTRPGKPPCWVIYPFLTNMEAYKEVIMNERLQDIIWNNARSCVYGERGPYFGTEKAPGCNPNKSCAGGKTIFVLGKEFRGCCVCGFGISIWNPGETAINKIKRLLELEKQARAENN